MPDLHHALNKPAPKQIPVKMEKGSSEIPVFRMHFEPMTIEHLGTKLYTRLPPVIGEIVSNSWDADAEKVEITFPEDAPTDVKVRDYGAGMTAGEIQDNYLYVGRDCRVATGRDVTPIKKRPIMGKKGIGKLAAFGIASQVEIRTVKDGMAICFRLDYDKMKAWKSNEDYPPDVIAERCGKTKEPAGTEVWLKGLRRQTPIAGNIIRKELAKRFIAVRGNDFKVSVNGVQITATDRMLKESCKKVWNVEDLPGGNVVSAAEGWKVSGMAITTSGKEKS